MKKEKKVKKKCIHLWKHSSSTEIEHDSNVEIITILYCEKCGRTKMSSEMIDW